MVEFLRLLLRAVTLQHLPLLLVLIALVIHLLRRRPHLPRYLISRERLVHLPISRSRMRNTRTKSRALSMLMASPYLGQILTTSLDSLDCPHCRQRKRLKKNRHQWHLLQWPLSRTLQALLPSRDTALGKRAIRHHLYTLSLRACCRHLSTLLRTTSRRRNRWFRGKLTSFRPLAHRRNLPLRSVRVIMESGQWMPSLVHLLYKVQLLHESSTLCNPCNLS